MKLPVLPPSKNLRGKKIFLRVDWNVPIGAGSSPGDSLKVARTVETVRGLADRGAIVLVATHLGRPKGRDPKASTKRLLPLLALHHLLHVHFLDAALNTKDGLAKAKKEIGAAAPGTIFLLEDVRFYPGEEKNDPKLASAFASLADLFVNDAFATCHRAHASVVGVARKLPHFAGPTLVTEVAALEKLLVKPKRPYVAIIGGAKLSTKLPVLHALLDVADTVMVGGAMATAFFAAKKWNIGTSFVEKEGVPFAKKLLKNPKLVLPVDVVVAKKVASGAKARTVAADAIGKQDAVGDIGPETMRAWAEKIRTAKTVIWNGPVGVTEIPAFAHGSMIIARAMAIRSKGPTYGVAGGGDTIPVVLASGMSEWFDHVSTGGGAMLDFIAEEGKLPGIEVLMKK